MTIANEAVERTRVKARFAGPSPSAGTSLATSSSRPCMTDPIIRVVDAANVDVTLPLSPAQLETRRAWSGRGRSRFLAATPEAGVSRFGLWRPIRERRRPLRISFVTPKKLAGRHAGAGRYPAHRAPEHHRRPNVVRSCSRRPPHVMIAAPRLAHRRDVRPGRLARAHGADRRRHA